MGKDKLDGSAVDRVAELAKKATRPHVVALSDEENLIFPPGGQEPIREKVPPPRRSHHLRCFGSLMQVVEEFQDTARVFVGSRVIKVCCDDGDRRDWFSLELTTSSPFDSLVSLAEKSGRLDQDQAIRLFFHDLRGYCVADLHQKFRHVTFVSSENANRTKGRDKESMGVSVNSELSASDSLPEVIEVPVPVYSTPGIRDRVSISMSVEIRHTEKQFQICPLPDALSAAMSEVLDTATETINEAAGRSIAVLGTFN